MTCQLIATNLSRYYDYTLVLNGSDSIEIAPLRTASIDIEAGEYEVSVRAKPVDDLTGVCKPIHVKIEDGSVIRIQIDTRNVAIDIFDEQGTLLNGRHGFICGHISEGVYVNNLIE